MKTPILFMSALMLLACSGFSEARLARADAAAPSSPTATGSQAERIPDTKEYLAELDATLALARAGGYGTLKGGRPNRRLEVARDRIARLLEGHSSTGELSPEDRVKLHNLEQSISSILRNSDKDRMICLRQITLGSRVPTVECQTVAQREARAKAARDLTSKSQQSICNPSEGRPCL